jgi:hypothetical protein
VANQGQEAFDKILASQKSSTDKIHVVLMDVEMPVLNVFPSIDMISNFRGCKQPNSFGKPKQTESFVATSLLLQYFPLLNISDNRYLPMPGMNRKRRCLMLEPIVISPSRFSFQSWWRS